MEHITLFNLTSKEFAKSILLIGILTEKGPLFQFKTNEIRKFIFKEDEFDKSSLIEHQADIISRDSNADRLKIQVSTNVKLFIKQFEHDGMLHIFDCVTGLPNNGICLFNMKTVSKRMHYNIQSNDKSISESPLIINTPATEFTEIGSDHKSQNQSEVIDYNEEQELALQNLSSEQIAKILNSENSSTQILNQINYESDPTIKVINRVSEAYDPLKIQLVRSKVSQMIHDDALVTTRQYLSNEIKNTKLRNTYVFFLMNVDPKFNFRLSTDYLTSVKLDLLTIRKVREPEQKECLKQVCKTTQHVSMLNLLKVTFLLHDSDERKEILEDRHNNCNLTINCIYLDRFTNPDDPFFKNKDHPIELISTIIAEDYYSHLFER